MHQLAVLRFCRDVLAERQTGDKWQGWFWAIRHKVIQFWIARLEREQTRADCVPELSPEERRAVRDSHPLLAARSISPGAVLKIDTLWQVELQGRVRRFVESRSTKR